MKRVSRKIWTGVLAAVVLCLMAMPVQAAMTKQQALNNYAKQMAKNPSAGTTSVYFTTADIDGNGIPELIRGYSVAQKNCYVGVLGINGKILTNPVQYNTKVLEFGYCPGKNRCVVINRIPKGSGQVIEYTYSKISGSKVIEVFKCGRDATESDPYYWKNLSTGKVTRVSATDLRNLLNSKIGTSSYNKVTFYSNTASNRTKIFGSSNGKIVSTISLDRSKATMYKGTTLRLMAEINGISSQVTWKSSNKKIATVDSYGKVTAKKAGKVTITAKANGVTEKCTITVKAPSIKLNKTKSTVYTGGSFQLKADVKGKSSAVIWSSGNSKIATVSSTGLVTAKKAGKVTIKAKANGKTAKCVVTVKAAPKMTLSQVKQAMTNYIDKHYNLDTVEKYNGFISYSGKSGDVYQFLFRSYTGAYTKFYVEASSGKIYMSERNPFTFEYEAKQYVGSAKGYL